ncbi:hypothetical protein GCM10027162_72560 [Streptomyces incanus]
MLNMKDGSEASASLDDVWTTPEVADFLKISRQAINRRVRSRKMLGYPGRGATLFPVWQFDPENGEARPEVAEYLAAFAEDFDPQDIARWSITGVGASGRTPAELLIRSETRDEALRLAEAYAPLPVEERTAPAVDPHVKPTGKDIDEWMPSPDEMTGAQHAILLAAADLFSRKGPASVSLREVAAAADVSYGLIHRFYRTKENLLVAVMELLVSYYGERLSSERDIYAAIDNSFGSDVDAGQFGRMLAWSILEGIRPDRLIGTARSRGYRSQIDALWENPTAPETREEFDANVVASLVALIGSVWDLYEPYLAELANNPEHSRDDVRREVTDILKVLVHATRPRR